MRHSKTFVLLVSGICFVLSGCASTKIPAWQGATSEAQARAIVERSMAAHGGDVFALNDLNVSYEGEWGILTPLMQPLMADKTYRTASQERYVLADRSIVQVHTGPAGQKTVKRLPGEVIVQYDGEVTEEADRLATSAIVADAYLMMIAGPSWFLRPNVELASLPAVREDGRTYDRVQAQFRPGFGLAEEDRALLWIDRETNLLHRVQFSIDGFRRTVGAEVGVTFTEHREIDGYLWPTYFVERVHQPVSAFAHRWHLTGLDVNRGLSTADLAAEELPRLAQAPAGAPRVSSEIRGETGPPTATEP